MFRAISDSALTMKEAAGSCKQNKNEWQHSGRHTARVCFQYLFTQSVLAVQFFYSNLFYFARHSVQMEKMTAL